MRSVIGAASIFMFLADSDSSVRPAAKKTKGTEHEKVYVLDAIEHEKVYVLAREGIRLGIRLGVLYLCHTVH